MEHSYQLFRPGPFVVAIVDRIYLNIVGCEYDENEEVMIAKVGKEYSANFGFVMENQYETEYKCCALRFQTNEEMLAFFLRYK